MSSWSEYFSCVPDPRRQSGLTKHLLSDILGIALCAMLCGADDFVEFALFGRERQAFLQQQLGFSLPAGVPSHDTFTRVFAQLQPQALEGCLQRWLHQWQDDQPATGQPASRRHLSVDGKVARGSWEHSTNVCALTSVGVFASELRLMLCCGRLPRQGGEHLLALSLLELMDLEGAIVTGDAAYCQKAVAAQVIEGRGDYVLALKTNQRTLYKQVQTVLETAVLETAVLETAVLETAVLETGHGRREERRVQSYAVATLGLSAPLLEVWPGLQSVVKVERVREVKNGQKAGQSSHSVWFYLSSLAPDEAALQQSIRAHWSIENQAHWVLDVVFGEDRCRTRKDHAPYNLALLRRISLNLLRQNQGKNSLKATRKAVAWNQDLLCKTLHTPLALV